MKNYVSGIAILILTLSVGMAHAGELTCDSQYGECTMTETTIECVCAGGDSISSGTATSTVIEEGESMEVSEENCLDLLEEMCRASTPVDSCDSEYGACVIYEEWSSCECADGSSSGGGEGSEPSESGEGDEGGDDNSVDPDEGTPPQSDKVIAPDESTVDCQQLLATECPNLPPDPAEECSEAELTICNGMAQFAYDCWGDKIWPYEIVDCCNEYKTASEAMDALWECFQNSSCDTVADDCFEGMEEVDVGFLDENKSGEDGAEGENQTADGDSEESADGDSDGAAADSDDSGCNQTAGAAPLALLLALMAFKKRSSAR